MFVMNSWCFSWRSWWIRDAFSWCSRSGNHVNLDHEFFLTWWSSRILPNFFSVMLFRQKKICSCRAPEPTKITFISWKFITHANTRQRLLHLRNWNGNSSAILKHRFWKEWVNEIAFEQHLNDTLLQPSRHNWTEINSDLNESVPSERRKKMHRQRRRIQ